MRAVDIGAPCERAPAPRVMPTDELASSPRSEEVARWSASGTKLSEVVEAADRLRRKEEHLATRTAVVNLVAVASDRESLRRTGSAMRSLGTHHPGRTVLLLCEQDPSAREGGGIDAQVRIEQAVADGHSIWWEEVSLVVRGPAASHLDSIVAPLVLPHLPTAVWFPDRLPSPGDPLASLADAVVVDSRFAEPLGASDPEGCTEAIASLAELCGSHPVVDLSWKRLMPWRELLARSFDPPQLRGFMSGVERVKICAQPGPCRLLAGWVSSRLDLSLPRFEIEDAVHASIEMSASHDGRQGHFDVWRKEGSYLVESKSTVDGEELFASSEELPDNGLSWSLAAGLSHLEHDESYERAIRAARSLWS